MVLGIYRQSLGPVYAHLGLAGYSNGSLKSAIAVEELNAEVHGIDYGYRVAFDVDLSRQVEFTIAGAALSKHAHDPASLVKAVHPIPQRIGYVNLLSRRIDRDSCWALEESFPTLQ